jgi:SAM-dependent methyltransferase
MTDQAEFWDERYKGEGFAFGTEPNAFLASQVHLLKPGLRALVPGDGEGRNGVWLAKRGLIVDTVDVSRLGVAKARKLAQSSGVSMNTEVADLLTWAWPQGQYDIVASIYVHFFDEDRPRMHRAMIGALKPGGLLILEAYRPEQIELQKIHHSGGPKTADMLYSSAKLRSDFEGASILMLEELEAELSEGARHRGNAAIIRAIVEKPS